jgi:hypothetical protein
MRTPAVRLPPVRPHRESAHAHLGSTHGYSLAGCSRGTQSTWDYHAASSHEVLRVLKATNHAGTQWYSRVLKGACLHRLEPLDELLVRKVARRQVSRREHSPLFRVRVGRARRARRARRIQRDQAEQTRHVACTELYSAACNSQGRTRADTPKRAHGVDAATRMGGKRTDAGGAPWGRGRGQGMSRGGGREGGRGGASLCCHRFGSTRGLARCLQPGTH